MLNALVRFHRGLWRSKLWVRLWLMLLGGVNMVGGLWFWPAVEARWTLVALAVSFLLMIVLTAAAGFSRLLGAGHFTWFPLLAWLATRLPLHPTDDPLGMWIRAVILFNATSLAIDVIDVVRYARGEREEVVSTVSCRFTPRPGPTTAPRALQ